MESGNGVPLAGAEAGSCPGRGINRFVIGVIFALMPWPALAQFMFSTSATTQYQYNTNLFDLQRGYAPTNPTGSRLDDGYYTYGGSFETDYLLNEQKFSLTASGSEFRYGHFTDLDHDEYGFDAGWNWTLGGALSGKFDVSRRHAMVSFATLDQTVLSVNTEQRESAAVTWRLSPSWSLDANALERVTDEPLVGAPNLSLTETSGGLNLSYGLQAGVKLGLFGSYLAGKYDHTDGTGNPPYDQESAGLSASYDNGAQSTLNGQVGYTRRTSSVATDAVSGFTGQLQYANQITGKTNLQVLLSRGISSYISNQGSQISTSGTVNLNWKITYKTSMSLGYTYQYLDLPGQGNLTPGSDRADHFQLANLNLDWEALDWLSVRPYANVQTRHTNFLGGNFNSTVYGVSLSATWRNQSPR